MDAFDKLAKLAGASVESVGEGLPRTRAEALALGVTRYFTGKPCKNGHITERTVLCGRCTECHRNWSRDRYASQDGKERQRQYNCEHLEVNEKIRPKNAESDRS